MLASPFILRQNLVLETLLASTPKGYLRAGACVIVKLHVHAKIAEPTLKIVRNADENLLWFFALTHRRWIFSGRVLASPFILRQNLALETLLANSPKGYIKAEVFLVVKL